MISQGPAVPTDALQIYRLRSQRGVVKRPWDDECVVYVTDARETHLLTTPCVHILDLLERGPASYAALYRALELLLGDADHHEVTSLLGQIVDTLGKIGLIDMHEEVS